MVKGFFSYLLNLSTFILCDDSFQSSLSRRTHFRVSDDVGVPSEYSGRDEHQYMSHVDKTVALYHQEVYLSPLAVKKQREMNNGIACETHIF